MRKPLGTLLLLSVFGLAPAQDSLSTSLQSHFKVDFAAPDMPAFRALGTEPGEMLRPADPKELALMLATEGLNSGILPRSFAAEFAPFQLAAAGRMTIAEYRKAPPLYNTRLSLGTHTSDSSSGNTDVALGIRTTLYNAGDMLVDSSFDSAIYDLLRLRTTEYVRLRHEYVLGNGLSESALAADTVGQYDSIKAEIATVVEQRVAAKVDGSIRALREQFKRDSWNKAIVDVAYAAKLKSSDSTTDSLEVAAHSFWLTATLPLGSLFQGLVGAKYALAFNDSAWQNSYAFAGRIYGGANNVKMFVECQFKQAPEPNLKPWLVNTGTEFLFTGGNWLELTLAWEMGGVGAPRLVPGVKYRFTLPESFTKF